MRDKFHRPLHDLRISITDRCNFRCGYCMPAHVKYNFLPKSELLTFEELVTIARIFTEKGVSKIRLTGGEPLLRKDVEQLVAKLSALPGCEDLAMTTNGYGLAAKARALKEAGLQRVTVSLDSLDPERFSTMSGRGAKLEKVLEGIQAAKDAGLKIKINTVLQRDRNAAEIVTMARFGREHGAIIRFIEYMDVGNLNEWQREKVVSAAEILGTLAEAFPFDAVGANYPGEVAKRYVYRDGRGEFGLIASVTQPFCGSCSRARLSASGQLYTCLFAKLGTDLKSVLRGSGGPAGVSELVARVWKSRTDRYSEERQLQKQESQEKVEMYHIGG